VQLFFDLEYAVMYLQNEAATAEALAVLTEVLRNHVPTASLGELKQTAVREHDATGRGLVRLAFGAPMAVDDKVATLLKNGLQDRDALVRQNAGLAVAVTTWLISCRSWLALSMQKTIPISECC
jgi:hypothetical protein